MSIFLGIGANQVSYSFTVDTGSAVLLATCRTPTSMATCGNKLPSISNYILAPTATVSDGATCTSTGIGCMLSPSNTCFLSEQVSSSIRNSAVPVLAWSACQCDFTQLHVCAHTVP